jgi:predicted RNA-binding Zn-ribbon protein involved in translation (DUF1610 family)
MKKNTKIVVFALLSLVLPFIGIPLLIITLAKEEKKENDESVKNLNNEKENQDVVETDTETNSNQNVNNEGYKIPKKKIQTLVIIGAVALAFMILGSILALTVGSIGNTLLLLTGMIEIFVAIVIFVIEHHKVLYTCPECGTKREQHIELVDTKTSIKSQETNLYRNTRGFIDCTITSYTYRYKYTYVCPKCGSKTVEQHTEDGGKIYQYVDGIVINKVKTPKSK